jgi:hypothetical protein
MKWESILRETEDRGRTNRGIFVAQWQLLGTQAEGKYGMVYGYQQRGGIGWAYLIKCTDELIGTINSEGDIIKTEIGD